MTKKDVIEFIKHDRDFIGAKNLYNKLPNKSLSAQNSFNRIGNTTENLRTIIYEICKLVNISEREFTIYMSKPVVKKEAVISLNPKKEENTQKLDRTKALLSFSPEDMDYRQIVALVKELKLKPENQKQPTLITAVEAAKSEVINKQVAEIPTEVKPAIKLRVQFPFLNEADCPDVLKILVADLITAYDTYADAHKELFAQLTQEQLSNIAATVVENYINNKLVFAELEHYKAKNELLGEHPIFERLEWESKMKQLNANELSKQLNNLTNNLNRNKSKLKQAANDEDKQRSEDLVSGYEYKLEFVKQLLDKK